MSLILSPHIENSDKSGSAYNGHLQTQLHYLLVHASKAAEYIWYYHWLDYELNCYNIHYESYRSHSW